MMDATYTRVGSEVFNWLPLRACSMGARLLWISLYISQRCRALPGLWVAGLPTIADLAKMPADETLTALDELITRDLAEYDREHEVLRFTRLPDRCERPQNGRHLRSMWTRFRSVPDCPVRNAHVRTLEWLLNDPVRPPTDDHASAWRETFGALTVPVHRHRGARKLLCDSTPSDVQLGLFQKPTESSPPSPNTDTVSHTVSIPTSISIRSGSEISSPDPESKVWASSAPARPIPPSFLPPQAPLAEGTYPGFDLPAEAPEAAPDLPSPPPLEIGVLLAAVASESAGRFAPAPVDRRLTEALQRAARECRDAGVGVADLRLVGRYLGAGGLSYRSDLGPVWLSRPGNLLDAVAQSRAWQSRGAPRIGPSPSMAGVIRPAPPNAFINGRRQL